MLLDQRRTEILKHVENRGFVSLSELAAHFGISESTARRDVEFLEGISPVRKTRGGASFENGEHLTDFEARPIRALKQKQLIAEFTAAEISDGEVVILDGGTTTMEVAQKLVDRELTVVTNSVPIVNLLRHHPNIQLISIGGVVDSKTGVALGPIARAALKEIQATRLIMSVGGIREERLFNTNNLLVETERQMMDSSDEVWVVTDSSKFGRSSLSPLCPLNRVSRLITDDGITQEWQSRLDNVGVEVSIPSAVSS